MTSLSGYLKKTLSLFSFLLIFLSSVSSTFAADNRTLLDITYQISEEGDLKTDLKFTIENNSIIPIVINYYTISLPYSNLGNLVVSLKGDKLDRSIHKQSVGSDVVINFDSTVVPVNDELTFSASFSRAEYVNAEESPSHISFPNSFPDIVVDTVQVKFPSKWDNLAWSSSDPKKNDVKGDLRTVEFNSPKEDYLNLILGEKLTYGFEIQKTITNSDVEEKLFDISVPSWTHGQRVLFSEISPGPDLVTTDKEGNLTFSYLVKAGGSLKTSIQGEILINEAESELDLDSLNDLIENSGYWKLDNESEYTRVALYLKGKGLSINSASGAFNELKSQQEREFFIKETYIYVINRFTPASIDDSSLENPLRAGVSQALQKEGGAVPEDYVDLLISILRHFGVPARMIVGYIPESAGYKTDGFFHTWLEYWNQDSNKWVMLDPALDDSVDSSIFNKTGGDHIALLQRENSSILPKLTYFGDSEMTISSKISQIDEHVDAEIELLVNSAKLTSRYIQADLEILNTGTVPVRLSEVNLLDSSDRKIDIQILSSLSESVIVPGSSIRIPITLSNEAKEALNQELKIEYSLANPLSQETSTVQSVNVEVVNYWWWNWLIKLISFIIFTAAFWITYLMFKRVRKIWA